MLVGRLTRNPELKYAQNDNGLAFAKYTLAVDKKMRKDSQGSSADFVPCIAFGKHAEFVMKYYKKGMRVVVGGRISTNSYTNSEGKKVYTVSVATDEHEFGESKPADGQEKNNSSVPEVDADGFMQLPDGEEDMIPFN